MDAQLKAKWVEALRSGEYRQYCGGIGDQHNKHLCCLGVGADIANPDLHIDGTEVATRELEKHGFPVSTDDSDRFVGIARDLIDMNDVQGKSFSEIADYIEQNL